MLMTCRALVLIALIALTAALGTDNRASALACGAQEPTDAADAETLAAWVVARQVNCTGCATDGAVLQHSDPGYYHGGVAYGRVVPYFAHLGVAGLLRGSTHPQRFAVARRYMAWFAQRAQDPIVLDWWVVTNDDARRDEQTTCPPGAGPSLCNQTDAEDSTAATFLGLCRTYVEAAGTWAGVPPPPVLQSLADVLLGLQDAATGLTWAKHAYRVLYTMDNAETAWGLDAAAWLASRHPDWQNATAAAAYADAFRRVRSGLGPCGLFDASARHYYAARHPSGACTNGNLSVWYPDAACQVWPSLFEVAPTDCAAGDGPVADADAARLLARVTAAHPTWMEQPQGAAQQWWPEVGVVAARAGGCADARRLWAAMRAALLPGFAWPWTVGSAGWSLVLIQELGAPGPTPTPTPAATSGAPRPRAAPLLLLLLLLLLLQLP